MRVFIAFFLLFFSLVGYSQQLKLETSLEEAKTLAGPDGYILMVFAGSDWCKPCMQFKAEILENESFEQYSKSNLTVLYLDFPSRRKNQLSKELQAQNEALAERFNKNGKFPTIVIIDTNEQLVGTINYHLQNASTFIDECKVVLQ